MKNIKIYEEILEELNEYGEVETEINIDGHSIVTNIEKNTEYNVATGEGKKERYVLYGYNGIFTNKEFVVVNKKQLKALLYR